MKPPAICSTKDCAVRRGFDARPLAPVTVIICDQRSTVSPSSTASLVYWLPLVFSNTVVKPFGRDSMTSWPKIGEIILTE